MRSARRRFLVLALASTVLVSNATVANATSSEAPGRTTRPVSWIPLSPTTSPSARSGSAMAFDPAINKMVLFGGAATICRVFGGDLDLRRFRVDAAVSRAEPAHRGSTPRWRMTRRSARSCSSAGHNFQADTWTYDGTTWTKQSPTTSPPPLAAASMTFDPRTNTLVLFGGVGGGVVHPDTWTYNGITWAKQSPATSPPARSDAAMAYDAADGNIVLFAGANGDDETCQTEQSDDTWTYDGTNWTQQSPKTSPPPGRSGARMADDSATGQLVLFGGSWRLRLPRLRTSTTRGRIAAVRGRDSRRRSVRPYGRAERWPTTSTRTR